MDEPIICSQPDTNPDAVWSLLLATGYLKVLHAVTEKEAVDLNSDQLYTPDTDESGSAENVFKNDSGPPGRRTVRISTCYA